MRIWMSMLYFVNLKKNACAENKIFLSNNATRNLKNEYKFLLIDQLVFIARVRVPIKCFYSRMNIVHTWCDKMNFVKHDVFLHVLKQAM